MYIHYFLIISMKNLSILVQIMKKWQDERQELFVVFSFKSLIIVDFQMNHLKQFLNLNPIEHLFIINLLL